ncbi:uncharacterized mitochondrial protein AtMg00310-like [Aegilops tauschii subsp. strangulata]|nr:uncharacterized mitochondrial protein AtMg00310-like [Aegilops tauschii subsp. strangulata]
MAQAGKETLIKAVAHAIPAYIMGVFKLPLSVCDDLTRMVRNYWWGSEKGKRKAHWMAWEKIIQPKARGGLGFRDYRIFNQALLARQAWRLLVNPDSLCARVLKAKYYPNGRLEDTVFAGNASSSWQAITYGLELLKKGLVWRVGNGQNVRILRDPWLPRPPSYRPVTVQGRCRLRRVADLLSAHGTWDVDLLRQYFVSPDVEEILRIRPAPSLDDVLPWAPDPKGVFSVRSAYKIALDDKSRTSTCAMSRAPDGNRAV